MEFTCDEWGDRLTEGLAKDILQHIADGYFRKFWDYKLYDLKILNEDGDALAYGKLDDFD